MNDTSKSADTRTAVEQDGLGDWRLQAASRIVADVPAVYPGGPSPKAGSVASQTTMAATAQHPNLRIHYPECGCFGIERGFSLSRIGWVALETSAVSTLSHTGWPGKWREQHRRFVLVKSAAARAQRPMSPATVDQQMSGGYREFATSRPNSSSASSARALATGTAPRRLVGDIVGALEPDTPTHSSDRIYDEAYVRHRVWVRDASGNELMLHRTNHIEHAVQQQTWLVRATRLSFRNAPRREPGPRKSGFHRQ